MFPQDHLVDPGDDHLGDDLSDYDHLGVDLLDDDHLADQAAVQGSETDSRPVSRSLLFSRFF